MRSINNFTKKLTSLSIYQHLVLFTLSAAHFVDDGLVRGFSILLPFIKASLNLNYFEVSLIGSTQSMIGAIGNPLMGWISDKTGKRKRLLILGVLGYFIGISALGITYNFLTLFLVLIIAQLSASIYHPQAISIINFNFKDRLHTIIGIHGAFGAVGLIVYPIILSYVIVLFGWRVAPTIVYMPMVIIVVILIYFFIKNPEKSETSSFNINLLKSSWFPITMLAIYSGLHAMAQLNGSLFFPLYLQKIKGFDVIQIGFWIGISSIGNIIGQFIVGFGADKFGTKKLTFLTSVFYSVFFYLFLSTNNETIQILLLILYSAANAASYPLVMSITTEIVDKEAVTITFGIIQSITSITMVFISPIMGYIADQYGLVFSMLISIIPVAFSGIVAFFIKIKERKI